LLSTEHGRGEENFKTGSFNKEYYSDAFSFSKDNENNEIGRETDPRGEGDEEESPNGLNSFQLMKMKNQGSMSSAQIIKYHDFVAKRAKKVFSSLLKGYSPV
jgi:hypothetical protein